MNCVYHMVPRNLTGKVLYPLNDLKQKHPSVYAAQIQKYKGRTVLLESKIPCLKCLWNDVLHFSPVHPEKIRDALLEVGFERYPVRWFEIAPALRFNAQNTAIYLSPPQEWLDFSKMAADFIPFSPEKLEPLSTLPAATVAYYKREKQQGKNPLLFHRVPHVLHRGNIGLDQLKIIQV